MIKRGSFITSAEKIAQGTGVPRATVKRILEYLENEAMIELHTTKRFSLVSVIKYKNYQSSEPNNEPQVSHKRATSEPQVATNKNVEEGKRMKKTVITSEQSSQDIVKFIDLWKDINPAYRKFFANKTERSASADLIKISPLSDWEIFLPLLQKMNADPFAKGKSTKPTELLRNIGYFKAWIDQKRTPDPKRKVAVIPND